MNIKNINRKPFYTLLSITAILTIVIASCKDKECGDPNEDDHYFIFGHFYGECLGEGCVEMYKLEDGRLYEDDLDHYPNYTTAIETHWNELAKERYEAVKDIENEFPSSLYSEPGHVLGQPDAGDWGGIYVEVYDGDMASTSSFWLLDKNENNMSQVYNDFVDKIEEKIALIQ